MVADHRALRSALDARRAQASRYVGEPKIDCGMPSSQDRTGVINAAKRERDDRHREMPLRVLSYFISACAISLALAWSEPAAAQRMKAGLLACDVSTVLLLWPFIMFQVSRYLPNTL